MYPIGEVVTLTVDKHEGAGAGSLTVNSGITGMIVNNGRACGPSNYSYVVDFGPEGQWNCLHNELQSVANPFADEEEGWDSDNDEELQQDITEEQAARIYADESARPGYGAFSIDTHGATPPPPPIFGDLQDNPNPNKKIDFEADLARAVAEAERNSKGA